MLYLQYLRIAVDDPKKSLMQLLNKYWNINDRSFCVSILSDGNIKDTHNSVIVKKSFYSNLSKIANSVAVCIFTSGYHVGVIKEIGQALNGDFWADDKDKIKKKIDIIGIASWGAILNRRLLQNQVVSLTNFTESAILVYNIYRYNVDCCYYASPNLKYAYQIYAANLTYNAAFLKTYA